MPPTIQKLILKDAGDARKTDYIANFYFNAADAEKTNPGEDIDVFLQAKVDDLDWGSETGTQDRDKEVFADGLSYALGQLSDVDLTSSEVLTQLKNGVQTNTAAVANWVKTWNAKLGNAAPGSL